MQLKVETIGPRYNEAPLTHGPQTSNLQTRNAFYAFLQTTLQATELIRSLSLEIIRKLGLSHQIFWPLDFLLTQTPTNLEHYSLQPTEEEVDAVHGVEAVDNLPGDSHAP